MKAERISSEYTGSDHLVTWHVTIYEDDKIFNGHQVEVILHEDDQEDCCTINKVVSIQSIGSCPISTTALTQLVDEGYFTEQFDEVTNCWYENAADTIDHYSVIDTCYERHDEMIMELEDYSKIHRGLTVEEMMKATEMYKKMKQELAA
jgi:hypothetical protein